MSEWANSQPCISVGTVPDIICLLVPIHYTIPVGKYLFLNNSPQKSVHILQNTYAMVKVILWAPLQYKKLSTEVEVI